MSVRCYGRAKLLKLDDSGLNALLQSSSVYTVSITADNLNVSLLENESVEANTFADEYGIAKYNFTIEHSKGFLLSQRIFVIRSKFDDSSEENDSSVFQFENATDASAFSLAFNLCTGLKPRNSKNAVGNDGNVSEFDARTEQASASQYFQFYGYLAQQQNMMQDYVRTSTYQRAIHINSKDFKDKVVMDVGAGSGILSFFAIQAGAKRVYAVEASSMSIHCAELVRSNHLSDRIIVVPGRVEEISIPEQVDVIISEPMGYMLVNERMLESYMHARKFLKNGGKMFPSRGELHFALFSDEALYIEQCSKANFWCQENFHGVNVSALRPQALVEVFKQPIVDTWHPNILMSGSMKWCIDFLKDSVTALHVITIPFMFTVKCTGFVHGIAFWFDVAFVGSTETIWLSTAPTEPLTHWYQVRCLFDRPLMAYSGQIVKGTIKLVANERQSYDVDIAAEVNGQVASSSLDLKNPLFRYTGAAVVPPPGNAVESPADVLLQRNTMSNGNMEMPLDSSVNNGFTSGYCDAISAAANVPAHQLVTSGTVSGNNGIHGADLIDIR
uniref:type I protein arginine methyltransferase n=1 Tax=Syphacia muris TaxID=451379 RepID=A0A0N5ASE9_9BILA